MKTLGMLALAAALTAAAATPAPAQMLVLNLTGQFRCVQGCAAGLVGQRAFVAQNGLELNLVNEAGEPTRAWIDYPGHIWAQSWNEGAIYSPDGMTIQFDRGTVWQRDLGEIVPAVPAAPSYAPPAPRGRTAGRPAERAPAAVNAFDGSWSVLILTQSGGCEPAYRYGVRISNGYLVNEFGDSVSLQGRVWPNGAVRVYVSSGGQRASGEGSLSRSFGSGVWRGEGAGGSCAGTWQATRRG